MKKDNKGFTLVELIVAIVILAILAAILVPALLGYIDRSRRSQDILKAKDCVTSMQAMLTECYGKGQPPAVQHNGNVAYPEQNKTSFTWYNPWRKKFFQLADFTESASLVPSDAPANLVMLVGHYGVYATGTRNVGITVTEADKKRAWTVYGAVYQKTTSDAPIFFNGESWEYGAIDLKSQKSTPYLEIDGKKVFVQTIFLCDSQSSNISAAWNSMVNWSED